jgi:hypothetical protein
MQSRNSPTPFCAPSPAATLDKPLLPKADWVEIGTIGPNMKQNAGIPG